MGDHLVSESDVATDIAARMRYISQLRVVSYAVDANQITFLLANGQRFRIGQIEELERQGGKEG